jgi:hypothetical protein
MLSSGQEGLMRSGQTAGNKRKAAAQSPATTKTLSNQEKVYFSDLTGRGNRSG